MQRAGIELKLALAKQATADALLSVKKAAGTNWSFLAVAVSP